MARNTKCFNESGNVSCALSESGWHDWIGSDLTIEESFTGLSERRGASIDKAILMLIRVTRQDKPHGMRKIIEREAILMPIAENPHVSCMFRQWGTCGFCGPIWSLFGNSLPIGVNRRISQEGGYNGGRATDNTKSY